MIVVISPEDREYFQFKFAANTAILGIDVVDGGAERADSVAKALARVKPDIDFVCIHDAARPCLADEWITDDLRRRPRRPTPRSSRIPVAGTLKRVGADHTIDETVSRDGLVGGPDAAGLSPAVAAGRPRQAGRFSRPPTTPNWSSGSASR